MELLSDFAFPVDALPSALLVAAWLALLRSLRYSAWRVAIFSLVGTIAHELLHLAAGWLFLAQPTSLSIIPKREGSGWTLGSVSFANLTIFNAAPVAFAPLLLIGVGWLGFEYWLCPTFEAGDYLNWIAGGYGVACCLFSCFPSSTDLKIGAISGVFYGFLGYTIWQAVG